MKLTKALKLKNSLVREVADLKNIVNESNVYFVKNTPKYDSKTKYSELLGKSIELAIHKAKIAVTNTAIYPQMFLMAEMKGLIQHLKTLCTEDGIRPAMHREAVELEYKATISKNDVDNEITRLTKEVERLQDAIDEHNATNSIE